MAGSKGPSPIVPFLMVGALGLLICGPALLSLVESLQLLFQGYGAAFSFVVLLPLVLLLLIHLLAVFFPTFQMSSITASQQTGSYDADGFGFGTVILVVLFFFLYNVM